MGTGDRGPHQVTRLPRCGPGGLGRRCCSQRRCPETLLDTMPDPDLPVLTPTSWPGLEGDSRTEAAPQRHLASHPRQRLQWSLWGGGGAGPGATREVWKPSPWPMLHPPIRHHLVLNLQIFLTTSDLTRTSVAVMVVVGGWTLRHNPYDTGPIWEARFPC